jgi:ubiquinol oxidase
MSFVPARRIIANQIRYCSSRQLLSFACGSGSGSGSSSIDWSRKFSSSCGGIGSTLRFAQQTKANEKNAATTLESVDVDK